jgi:hypothetical protein
MTSQISACDRPVMRRPVKMNSMSGPNRTGHTAEIERAVR